VLAAGAANRVDDARLRAQQLQSRFGRLQTQATLSSVVHEMEGLGARANELPGMIAQLRKRGYVHAGYLENSAATLLRSWKAARPQWQRALQREISGLRSALLVTEQQINRLAATQPATITAAGVALDTLESEVEGAQRTLNAIYGPVQQQRHQLDREIESIEDVLDQFEAAAHVTLRAQEAPLMAVAAEWQRDGQDGPQGTLFLTDQRLLFEQNEEVATEKLFGLFATAKERIQRLLIDVGLDQVEKIEDAEEGGFLGIGEAEVLALVLGARAPVSRARFHLKGADSTAWAVLLRKAKSREIDRERADAFQAPVADLASLVFPGQCPACLAPVPPPSRGVTAVSCEYCGTVIKPEVRKENDTS
jgi:hypothetical protein